MSTNSEPIRISVLLSPNVYLALQRAAEADDQEDIYQLVSLALLMQAQRYTDVQIGDIQVLLEPPPSS